MKAGKIVVLPCKEIGCGRNFRYQMKRSPNYPRFCPECAERRYQNEKLKYEEIRGKRVLEQEPTEKINEIRDYPESPFQTIDRAILIAT